MIQFRYEVIKKQQNWSSGPVEQMARAIGGNCRTSQLLVAAFWLEEHRE